MLPQGDQTESNTYNNENYIVSVENPIYNTHIFGCSVEKKNPERCTSVILDWWEENQKWVMDSKGEKKKQC